MVNLNKIYYGYFYSFQVWEVLVDTVQGYSLPTASSSESRTNVATIFLYKLSANVDLIII